MLCMALVVALKMAPPVNVLLAIAQDDAPNVMDVLKTLPLERGAAVPVKGQRLLTLPLIAPVVDTVKAMMLEPVVSPICPV